MLRFIKRVILNIPASFFFAFGFGTQIVSSILNLIAGLGLRLATKMIVRKELQTKTVKGCQKEVTEWEKRRPEEK